MCVLSGTNVSEMEIELMRCDKMIVIGEELLWNERGNLQGCWICSVIGVDMVEAAHLPS